MGSSAIGSVREFIRQFVESMPIGPNEVQVGIVMFGTTPRLEMDLNTHGTRESLTAALGSIKPRPGQSVNIGAALDFVRTNMLRPEKGSRYQQQVPQLLLVLTSKKSSDSVAEPVNNLLSLGALTLAAGPKSIGEENLRKLAFTENFAYGLKDLRVLGRFASPMTKTVVNALSTLAGTIVTEVPTEPGNSSMSFQSSLY